MGARGPQRNPAREVAMAQSYRDGKTLQEIGDEYGITRERVRQLIKRHGVTQKQSGRRKAVAAKKMARHWATAARKDARSASKFGCTYTLARHINGGQFLNRKGTPAAQYWSQKHSAESLRGIEWRLTFPEWMQIWHDSGRYAERGHGRDKFCMARKGDSGPYEAGNVYITTCADNVRDYQADLKVRGVVCADGYTRLPEKAHKCDGKPRSGKAGGTGRGWTYVNRSGRNPNPYQVVCGKEYIGSFPTEEAASAAYLAACARKYGNA